MITIQQLIVAGTITLILGMMIGFAWGVHQMDKHKEDNHGF